MPSFHPSFPSARCLIFLLPRTAQLSDNVWSICCHRFIPHSLLNALQHHTNKTSLGEVPCEPLTAASGAQGSVSVAFDRQQHGTRWITPSHHDSRLLLRWPPHPLPKTTASLLTALFPFPSTAVKITCLSIFFLSSPIELKFHETGDFCLFYSSVYHQCLGRCMERTQPIIGTQ